MASTRSRKNLFQWDVNSIIYPLTGSWVLQFNAAERTLLHHNVRSYTGFTQEMLRRSRLCGHPSKYYLPGYELTQVSVLVGELRGLSPELIVMAIEDSSLLSVITVLPRCVICVCCVCECFC